MRLDKKLIRGADAVTIDPFEAPYASDGSWSAQTSSASFNAKFLQSGSAEGHWITFAPRRLRAGSWSLALQHSQAAGNGIYTVDVSTDNETWTTIATIDGYAATSTATLTTVSEIDLAGGSYYLRFSMLAKSALNTGSTYYGKLAGISLTRQSG